MSSGTEVRFRVTVPDVWDTVTLALAPDVPLRELKARALERALGRETAGSAYVLKYRGATVLDEECTVGDLGAPDGSAFIVLPGRRQPVR
jgi:hypothetical protein